MRIRRFEKADIPFAVGLGNLIYPFSPRNVELVTREHERRRYRVERYHEDFIGEVDGAPAARLQLAHNELAGEPGTFNISIVVAPAHRDRGCGRELWELARRRLKLLDWRRLTASVAADQQAARDWLERLGFACVHEDRFFRLRLADYQRPADYDERLARVADQGIELVYLGDIDDLDEQTKRRKLWDIWSSCEADVPHGMEYERMPYEHWNRMVDNPVYDLDGMLVARDGDDFVGVTGLIYPGGRALPGFVIITGVRPAYRRRGIATALKYRDMDGAAQRGVAELITGNAVGNEGVLRINLRLGFQPLPSNLTYLLRREV